jgi:hypothetical protein
VGRGGLHHVDAGPVDIEELFMTKEEALAFDLALDALESERPYLGPMPSKTVKAITAIKQARLAPVQPVANAAFSETIRRLREDHHTWRDSIDRCLEAAELLEKHLAPAAPAQPAPVAQPVQEPVAWVLLREDEDGFEPIQFYGGKEKPETAAGELKPRFTLRPVCFADTTPPKQPTPVPTSWMEMVTANLVREGVNKHKARELAEHFYGLAQPAPVQPAETRSFHGRLEEERKAEREACAKVAADYGPSRPIVSKNPAPQIVGRWEGEQAASAGIEAAIRARGEA